MRQKTTSVSRLFLIAVLAISVITGILSSPPAAAATTRAKCVVAPCNVPAPTPPPTAPNLQFTKTIQPKCVTFPCSETVQLIWNANPTEEYVSTYELYRNGSLRATIASTAALSFRDTVSGSNATYTYMVRAIGLAGTADSNTVSYTTKYIPDTEAPTAPTNLRAVYTEVGDRWGALLTWEPASDRIGVDHYIITRVDKLTREVHDIKVTSAQTAYTDLLYRINAAGPVNLEYFVLAVDAAGNSSEYSNQALFPPGATLAANPITIGSRYGARLSWSLPADTYPANYFVITRGDSEGNVVEFTVAGDLTRYDDLMFNLGTGGDMTFYYQITAYDEYGNFLYTSNSVVFHNTSTPSTGNKKLNNQLYTQPRPRA